MILFHNITWCVYPVIYVSSDINALGFDISYTHIGRKSYKPMTTLFSCAAMRHCERLNAITSWGSWVATTATQLFRMRYRPVLAQSMRDVTYVNYDDVIKWKHFPRYWPFVRGIHRSPVNSPHKGQWRGALMICMICAWINGWVNTHEAGDLRRHCAHYDVFVVIFDLYGLDLAQAKIENVPWWTVCVHISWWCIYNFLQN